MLLDVATAFHELCEKMPWLGALYALWRQSARNVMKQYDSVKANSSDTVSRWLNYELRLTHDRAADAANSYTFMFIIL